MQIIKRDLTVLNDYSQMLINNNNINKTQFVAQIQKLLSKFK